jgi:hypothetical protein
VTDPSSRPDHSIGWKILGAGLNLDYMNDSPACPRSPRTVEALEAQVILLPANTRCEGGDRLVAGGNRTHHRVALSFNAAARDRASTMSGFGVEEDSSRRNCSKF